MSAEQMTAGEVRCEKCRFWEFNGVTIVQGRWKDYAAGDCKRRAPIATEGMHRSDRATWPQTAGSDWCGEYAVRAALRERGSCARKGPTND